MNRQLAVFIDSREIGLLDEADGSWRFTYAPSWLSADDRFPLAPALPLQAEPLADAGSLRPVQWYFDNLLPEEAQRTLLARPAGTDPGDAFGLLAYYGGESAGSVSLLPTPATAPAPGGLKPLGKAELSERIRKLPRVPLTADAPKKMSLAGAQHKLAVNLVDGQLHEPMGATASTHILKPDHPSTDYPHSVTNEWFTMSLARVLGLKVAAVRRFYVPEPVYVVDRFDRLVRAGSAAGTAERLHAIDACQALGLASQFKYQQARLPRLLEVANLCRNRPAARLALFSWLVFNVLVGNADNHLKNISLMAGAEGLSVAPAYDLLCTAVYETRAFDQDMWPRTTLIWSLPGAERYEHVNRDSLLQAGEGLRLGRETCLRVVQSMIDKVDGACGALYQQAEQDNMHLLAQSDAATRPSLQATFAGELRCLRAIHKVVIAEMSGRIS